MAESNWGTLLKTAEEGPKVLPVGTYDVRVVSAKPQKAQPKAGEAEGKDMINTKFEVVTGPYVGQPVYTNFVISPENPNALKYFFAHMAVLGADQQFFATNPGIQQVADRIVNAVCTVKVEVRTWNNMPKNEIKAVEIYTGAPIAAPGAPAVPAAPQAGVAASGSVAAAASVPQPPAAPQPEAFIAPQQVPAPAAPSVPF